MRDMTDQNWNSIDDTALGRKITFLNTYQALLDYFKALMTPYLATVLPPSLELLRSYAKLNEEHEEELWTALLDTLSKSLMVDEGGTLFRICGLGTRLPDLYISSFLARGQVFTSHTCFGLPDYCCY